jgi:hypothetical protein
MATAKYFNPENFIDQVIDAMKIGNTPVSTMQALRDEIEMLLAQRIVDTVISDMGKRELGLFEKVLDDHPELDEIDALMMLAPDLPGVKEKMERQINSLYFELVSDAETIGKQLNPVTV